MTSAGTMARLNEHFVLPATRHNAINTTALERVLSIGQISLHSYRSSNRLSSLDLLN